ncbi:GAF and ANTAR domain-containing protein [soil metagenome]
MINSQLLTRAFVELADTLVDDFEVTDLLHTLAETCTELLDVDAAGVMLTDQRGGLRMLAASSERARLLELFELQHEQGPCVDCYRSGRPVSAEDTTAIAASWPLFAAAAGEAGFQSVHAVPMRLRAETIGAFNLFRRTPGPLLPEQAQVAQALADVATVGLLQERAIHAQTILAEQLQTALNSRIRLEQAKGMLAERAHVDPGTAFQLMREHARRSGRRLSDIASQVIDGGLDIAALASTQ